MNFINEPSNDDQYGKEIKNKNNFSEENIYLKDDQGKELQHKSLLMKNTVSKEADIFSADILPLKVSIEVKDETLEFDDFKDEHSHNIMEYEAHTSSESIEVKDETLEFHDFKDEHSHNIMEYEAHTSSESMMEGHSKGDLPNFCNSEFGDIRGEDEILSSFANKYSKLLMLQKNKNLKKRVTIAGEEHTFCCALCSYETKVKRNLKTHLIIHTDEKPFTCKFCSYKTKHKSSLQTHVRTHTGDRPYKCEFCPFSAAQSTGLRTHLRIHTGEKPYKCVICPFSASQSFHLKSHLRIHTGEKPFKCDNCTYRTTEKSALDKHIKIHTRVVFEKEGNLKKKKKG